MILECSSGFLSGERGEKAASEATKKKVKKELTRKEASV